MKVFKKIIFCSLIAAGGHAKSNELLAEGSGSSGGNLISMYFTEGQALSIQEVQNFKINGLTSSPVEQWIVENRTNLVEELKQSKIVWTNTKKQEECAETGFEPGAEIRLKLSLCRFTIHTAHAASRILTLVQDSSSFSPAPYVQEGFTISP